MYDVLFQYGPITLRTFNIFLAIAFLTGILFLLRYAQRRKMNISFLANHFIGLSLSGIVGGRLLEIIENLSFYQENLFQAFKIWDFKLSSFGALYGILTALYYFSKKEEQDFWAWLDAGAVSSMVTLFFIHIGHFFNGSHYGSLSDLPWAIAFDTLNIPFINPIHPTQLYSALTAFLVLVVAMKYNRRTHLSGMVGSLIIMLYSGSAFGIDFLHGVESSYAKISFLVLAGLSFIAYIHCSHKTHLNQK